MSAAASVTASASALPPQQEIHGPTKEGKVKARALQEKDSRSGLPPRPPCVRWGLMLVWVLSFLPSLDCDPGGAPHPSREIVIPTTVPVEGRAGPGEGLAYALFMQGQRQLIHLRLKRDYFVSNFPVFSYRHGILGQEKPFLSRDCHYEGYIEGVPGSFVSLNTCSGLRGVLIKDGRSYGMEPVASSRQAEHVLYSVAPQSPISCSVSSQGVQAVPTGRQREWASRKPGGPHTPSSLRSYAKYVEMFVVVNHQRFRMWGSDVNKTVRGVMDIIALANSFTRGINTEVVLVGLELWTEGDLVQVSHDLQVALSNFNSWRRKALLPRAKHDVAHMIVGQDPGGATGQAFLGGACSDEFAAAVESFHHEDALLFAALLAHELGHNLGIEHDHAACACEGQRLGLMRENVTAESSFSDCSSHHYYRFLEERRGACLFNKPGRRGRRRRQSVCGNGVREEGEQCDCGQQCTDDPCCEPTCKLKAKAQCVPGPCCNSRCRFEPKGLQCRAALSECDLPEYCKGDSDVCPDDTYKLDGSLCQRVYYCINGSCWSRDNQCANIYGFSALSASEECYTAMNSQGNRFGNCGLPSAADQPYVKCTSDNILCGKLICTGIRELPSIKPQHTMIQVSHGDEDCWSMDVYTTSDIPDEGDVRNGTYCAPNKACMNSACTDYKGLPTSCEPAVTCNGNGVCNNLNHCHCDSGYAPPDCKLTGDGGSVDSGSPAKITETPGPEIGHDFTENIKSEQRLLDTAVTLGIIGFIILSIFAIIWMITACRSAMASPPAPTEMHPEAEPIKTPVEGAAPEEAAAEEAAAEEAAPEEGAAQEDAPEEEAPEEQAEEGEEEREEEEAET